MLHSEGKSVVITMKDYDEIRKRYLAGESQRHIAKTLGISRNTVAKYCEGAAVPWERKTPERVSTILTDETVTFIRSCLEEDKAEGLKKQRHTAKRIYDRLVEETGFTGGESTVRAKVHELKQLMPSVFLPLLFDPGEALQVDWGEAFVYIKGKREKVNLFCARLCYSCRPVVLAYHRQNEESFLDAFVRSFQVLDGTSAKVIFDNGKVAVKDGSDPTPKSRKAIRTSRLITGSMPCSATRRKATKRDSWKALSAGPDGTSSSRPPGWISSSNSMRRYLNV
jgi:transposase